MDLKHESFLLQMKIVVKYPTRERPALFRSTLNHWIKYLSGKHKVHFVITLDNDDESMKTPEMKRYLKKASKKAPSHVTISYHYGDSKNKIEAVNADLEGVQGDILILCSDDMIPQIKGYDDRICQDMERYFPDLDGCLNYFDGRRLDFPALMTLAIMGWKYYLRFGYIYYPGYESLYCDNEQTQVATILGKIQNIPECIILHDWACVYEPVHSSSGDKARYVPDALRQKTESSEYYKKDGALFQERSKHRFFIENKKG